MALVSVYSGDTPIKVVNMSLGSTGSTCSNAYQGVSMIYMQ